MAFYGPMGEWEGSPGMMYFPILNFGAIWKPRILKITGLDLNELVTSFDNFLAPGASVKVQIHVSISTVFFMKTWAAWWTAFAGMVILVGRGDWHFKIEEPLRGVNRFPPKKSFFTTIGIPFNETASNNTVLGFVFCWSHPVRQWHQTASRNSMCLNAHVKVMRPFRIKRTNSSSLNPSKLASRHFAAQWRGRICNMPSPIAVLKEKLFEFQRIGQKLASRYWRKEAESKAFNLGEWWWLQIFFRKGRWNLKGRIYIYIWIYIYICIYDVYGCFFWGDDRQDIGLIETGFIFPFPNHRDSESAAPESDCISSGMEALVSCGSWTLGKPMLGWMGMENDGKGWKVWQFQAFFTAISTSDITIGIGTTNHDPGTRTRNQNHQHHPHHQWFHVYMYIYI